MGISIYSVKYMTNNEVKDDKKHISVLVEERDLKRKQA